MLGNWRGILIKLKSYSFSIESIQEDCRKVGIVCVGAGLLAVVLKLDPLGIFPALLGIICLLIGWIRPKQDTETSHSNEEKEK